MYRFFIYSIFLLTFLLVNNCSSDSDYDSMVRKGLESGIEQDSLFLGYYLGMSKKDFFSSSWQMNKEEIITGQRKIVYELNDLPYPANMEFYPFFKDDVISRMPVSIGYQGWAPWNDHLTTDELITELVKYYNEIYDATFTLIYVPEINREALVSIQGNREIRIYPETHSNVLVEFIDLSNQ